MVNHSLIGMVQNNSTPTIGGQSVTFYLGVKVPTGKHILVHSAANLANFHLWFPISIHVYSYLRGCLHDRISLCYEAG